MAGPEAQALRPLNLTPSVTGAKAGQQQQQAVSKQVGRQAGRQTIGRCSRTSWRGGC